MNTLLVAFDGSASALRALRHAIGLTRDCPPRSIHLVTAHEEPVVFDEIAFIPYEQLAELNRQQSERVLEGVEALLKESGIPYRPEIVVGSISHRIAERADELGCEGIVMGTHGRTPIASLLMGSVASKVIHHANVPVTLVK